MLVYDRYKFQSSLRSSQTSRRNIKNASKNDVNEIRRYKVVQSYNDGNELMCNDVRLHCALHYRYHNAERYP